MYLKNNQLKFTPKRLRIKEHIFKGSLTIEKLLNFVTKQIYFFCLFLNMSSPDVDVNQWEDFLKNNLSTNELLMKDLLALAPKTINLELLNSSK